MEGLSERICDELLVEIVRRIKGMNRTELEKVNEFIKTLEENKRRVNCK